MCSSRNSLSVKTCLPSASRMKELVRRPVRRNGSRGRIQDSSRQGQQSELQLFADIRRNNPPLGAGEVGAIPVARLHKAGLISSDRQARKAASELGIAVFGSLGILSYAVESGTISGEEAVRILSEMILAGAWLSEELVEAFRRDVLKN